MRRYASWTNMDRILPSVNVINLAAWHLPVVFFTGNSTTTVGSPVTPSFSPLSDMFLGQRQPRDRQRVYYSEYIICASYFLYWRDKKAARMVEFWDKCFFTYFPSSSLLCILICEYQRCLSAADCFHWLELHNSAIFLLLLSFQVDSASYLKLGHRELSWSELSWE